MPLFNPYNLEHTSCKYGCCGNNSEPYVLVPIKIQEIINNPINHSREQTVVTAKLTRDDFNANLL